MNHSLVSPHQPRPARVYAGMAVAAAMLMATTSNAWAFSCTWGGALSSSASNAANWRSCAAPGGIPGAGDDVFFPDNADRRTFDNDFAVPPTFRDVTFESGYTVSGGTLKWSGEALISVPFTATANIDGSASSTPMQILDATQGLPGKAYFLGQFTGSPGGTYVGNGSVNVPIVLTSGGSPYTAIVIGAGGRLSTADGYPSGSMTVKPGGTLALSDLIPGLAPPATLGGATVTGALGFESGAVLEYRAYPPGGYQSGRLLATSSVALNGATLNVVEEDPANPHPVGTLRTLVAYGDPSQLTGTFAGLPEGATFAASNAPGVHYRISYGSAADPRITLTRMAAPVVPPGPGGDGTVAVPTLGHAGLALLSACMAGVGLLRRRRKA